MKKINNKGFSLIELIVAIAIIAIAGTSLFNGFVIASKVHMNTTELQMAEDMAQDIAEEFNSNYVDTLKSKYNSIIAADASAAGGITDSIVDGVRTVTFTNIPYTYEARPQNQFSEYLVDIKLTSKKTATGEVVRDTTYKQSSTEEASFYQVGDTVGTNSFIVPEVTNIYDGKRVVVSSEINQYDNSVWSDLFNVIKQKFDEKNALLVGDAKYNPNEFENAYTMLYYPYTKITDDKQLIKKTNIKVKSENGSGGTIDFYYIVTVEYEFNFDFPLVTMGGLLGAHTAATFIDDGTDLATVSGATSTYTVSKSGEKYIIKYSKVLTEAEAGDTTTEGSFGGKIYTDPIEPTDPPLTIKADGTGDGVPYLYILYSPFDLYSDPTDGECNDIVTFECDIPGGPASNIVRVFLVEQKLTNLADTTKTSKLMNCDIKGSYPEESFKVYTNSTEVIEETGNKFAGKNYLTNSYGKNRFNLYDMEITVKSRTTGQTVATYNTVKEE